MKRVWVIIMIAVSLLIGVAFLFSAGSVQVKSNAETDTRFANVYEQEALMKTGRRLIKSGDFEVALEKFNEALSPKYIKTDRDKTEAVSTKRDIYILQGNYQAALKEHQWLFERNPDHDYVIAKQKEILALIEWEKTKDNKLIYDHISFLKDHFRGQIPPEGYSGYKSTIISTILRLYDTIGDHDAGIAYIDEILSFLRERRKAKGDESYVLYDLKSSQEASKCVNRSKPNPDYHGCKFMREYLLVREAFERDKAEGTKGRATQALIQSDYFPW